MEFSKEIKKFAELELERERKETIRQLTEMDDTELAQVLVNTVAEQMKLVVEMEKVIDRGEELDTMYAYLRQVYADKYGIDVDQIQIQFIPEDEEFEDEC